MFYNDQIVFLAVELKYCERCGGIYTRQSGSGTIFCESCVRAEQKLGFLRKPSTGIDATSERWRRKPGPRYLCVTSVAQAQGGVA
jgi:hypothetical protein